jgi:PhzF family phenazine biosynthesis protein
MPTNSRFAQVDVFGETPGSGNPVAVVVDAEGLDDDELQAIATWTNLSETTFLLPPTTDAADYRVRIFTPARELPFAGHPTLGSAHAWLEANGGADREALVQECGAGLVALRRIDGRLAFAAPPRTQSGPLDDETLAAVVASLGIAPDEVVDHEWCVNGPTWATVLLAGAERVLELQPQPGPVQDIGVVGLHPDGTPELRAIVLDPHFVEDPVTGSLNAGVAQWLLGTGRLQAPYVARQGTAIGRRGRVHVSEADGDVWIGGATTTVVDGALRW